MPEDIAPAILPDVNLDSEPFKFGTQTVDDSYALKLVTQDFFNYENYRRTNHDNRWNGNDALYCAYMPQKVWEGSKIPKASHSQPLVFAHVETAQPIIEQALFGQNADWFQCEPEPGGDPNEARAIKDHLLYLLEHDGDDLGRTARREFGMSIKSILTYGNGGLKIYHDPTKKKPCAEWVDIRDIYIDPGCSTPSVDEARSLIERKFYTVEELWEMREAPGMNIPEKAMLNFMAKRPMSAPADQTKTMQEAFRGVNYVPGSSDYTANPADRKIEVLIYYSKNRIIWVLSREWVAFNGPNPYNFIPFVFAPCFNFLSRFYALGYPDVLENSQRYAEGLQNAHINELSLILNPPRVKKAGGLMTPAQERYYPGATFQVTNPKDDMVFQTPQQATANVMADVGFILAGAEKITGVNGAAGGNFSAGNVNRTKGGVDAQVAGANSRIYSIIKNIEDYLIVPLLYKMYKLIQFHTDKDDLLPALGPNDEKIEVGAAAFQKPMRFRMVAASRMMSRDKLLQILPVINQYFMNGAFLGQLHSADKTVDFDEFQNLIQEATGTSRIFKLIRALTPDEKQALNQPPPQAQAAMQQKQADLQNRKDLQQMKTQGAIQLKQTPDAPSADAAQQAQLDAAAKQQEMAQSAQQAQMDQAGQAASQQATADQAKQQMILGALQKHHELQTKQRQDAEASAQRERDHAQKLHHSMAEHQQKLRHAEEQNTEKLRAAKILAALKAQEAMQPSPAPQSGA